MSGEVGRELTVPELRVRTVVLIGRDDRPTMVTTWVTEIGQDFVAFTMGVTKTTFIAAIREDGTLGDDTGTRIRVFDYLGEI